MRPNASFNMLSSLSGGFCARDAHHHADTEAARLDPATMQRSAVPFVVSFVAELIMAVVLTLVVGAITGGEPNPIAGLLFGFVLWLGFIATTLAVNHRYEGFGWVLTLIDAGHWLGVMLIIGAVIGWFGAPGAPAG